MTPFYTTSCLHAVCDGAGEALRLAGAGLDVAVAAGAYERLGTARALNPLAPGMDHLLVFERGFDYFLFYNLFHGCCLLTDLA